MSNAKPKSTEQPSLSDRLAKNGLDRTLKKLTNGRIDVTYWDGDKRTYGSGKKRGSITVTTPGVVWAMARNFTLGFGESYVDGSLKVTGDLAEITRLAADNQDAFGGFNWNRNLVRRNQNRQRKQKQMIAHHYDLGNDFYKMWLDRSMTYSCAYFEKPTDSLEKAQEAKRQHLLRKLMLQPGQRLLDIGCGWGHLLFDAVKQYDVVGHGITLSQEQYNHCVAEAKRRKLSDKLTFELIGYQELAKRQGLSFDRIISVGMFEHVGKGNQSDYFDTVNTLLVPGGVSVLHTISNQRPTTSDPWIDRYIFPGGYIPAATEVFDELPKRGFQLLDYENLRLHYSMTLDIWRERFEEHKAEVIKMYDQRFYRMWRLYLAASSSGFRYGELGLSQVVFSKGVNNELPLTRQHQYR